MKKRRAQFLLVVMRQSRYWPITLWTVGSRGKWGLAVVRFDSEAMEPCEHGTLTHAVACTRCLFPSIEKGEGRG